MHLKPRDFKYVGEYNSALFIISSQLKLCVKKVIEEILLEEILTTFYVLNVVLHH